MLARFEVTNFKQFKETLVLDLAHPGQYAFNPEAVRNGLVNKALIYGPNGCGKSNLGFAIFDLIFHLTDQFVGIAASNYMLGYMNADSDDTLVKFKYVFEFDGRQVIYEYGKNEARVLIYETLSIDGCNVIDYLVGERLEYKLAGTETLKKGLGYISALRYIRNNAVLEQNETNELFTLFYGFVDKMLFFRSLDCNEFLGVENYDADIGADIITRGNLQELEGLLNTAGIACTLRIGMVNGQKEIFFKFKNKEFIFQQIASSGTKVLSVFYFWYQHLKQTNEISFVFIDEFDAYYHHALAKLVVEMLKQVDAQVILTTHNTNLMTNDLLRPDCYFIMDNNQIKSLQDCTDKELREAHNLEKIYRAGGFNV